MQDVEEEERPERMGGEMAASVYYSNHNLREMFSRENAERRRGGSKMLRRHLSAQQDKSVLNKMVRIREEYEVANNDDVIVIWAQMMEEDGKGDEVPEPVREVAKRTVIPKREKPFSKTPQH